MGNWFVYIVKCADESYYTGISTNVERRIFKHNSKLGAKSLKGKLPVVLVYREPYKNQVQAAKREREIKGWNREKKLELVESSNRPLGRGFIPKGYHPEGTK